MEKRFRLFLASILLLSTTDAFTQEESQSKQEEQQSFWYELSSGAQSLTDSTLKKAGELSGSVGNAYNSAVTLSKETLNNFLASMDESVMLMERLGYDITDIYVNVGIIPEVSFKVSRLKVLTTQQQNEILKQ